MQRYAEGILQEWLTDEKRKPLIIRGARQVGKSTLVEIVAESLNIPLCKVNLERHPQLDDIFSSNDPEKIIAEIGSLHRVTPLEPGGILFLDEIQSTPSAIGALRYFYEERPDVRVIAAGSLLEFALNKAEFSMPVGRIEYLYLYPMRFEEFLLAMGERKLLTPGTQVAHERLCELQRIFFFVGGMPEAIATYCDTKNFDRVRKVHHSILETYQDDFPKYAGSRNLGRIQKVFEYVALHVGQKVKYSNIDNNEQSRTLKGDIRLLTMAKIVTPAYHTSCSGLPLKIGKSESVFKLFFLDVGLMNAVAEVEWRHMGKDRDLKNEGPMAEQFVAQSLLLAKPSHVSSDLFYWQREGKSGNAEVDFVESIDQEIIPIEVKSGSSGRLRSLREFVKKHRSSNAIRLDLNSPSKQELDIDGHTFTLKNIPLYHSSRLVE